MDVHFEFFPSSVPSSVPTSSEPTFYPTTSIPTRYPTSTPTTAPVTSSPSVAPVEVIKTCSTPQNHFLFENAVVVWIVEGAASEINADERPWIDLQFTTATSHPWELDFMDATGEAVEEIISKSETRAWKCEIKGEGSFLDSTNIYHRFLSFCFQ